MVMGQTTKVDRMSHVIHTYKKALTTKRKVYIDDSNANVGVHTFGNRSLYMVFIRTISFSTTGDRMGLLQWEHNQTTIKSTAK